MSQNIPPNTDINLNVTVGKLQSILNEYKLSPDIPPQQNYIKCDYCSSKIYADKENKLSQYLCDDILNNNHPKSSEIHQQRLLTQLATYCEDCSDELLFLPCREFAEVRVMFTSNEDWIICDPEITDVSPRDDGINWNPIEVSNKISPDNFNFHSLMVGNELWGPENIFTIYDSALKNVAMGSLIRYDGSLDSDVLKEAKKEYIRFLSIMSKNSYDESKFTRYVKDK